MGKRCEIIATDTNFVYYGYPYPPTMNEVTKADTIFKTQIKVLTKQFSSFETIEGYHVKSKIIQSLRPYFDSSVNYTVKSTSYSDEFRLEPDKISVSMKTDSSALSIDIERPTKDDLETLRILINSHR